MFGRKRLAMILLTMGVSSLGTKAWAELIILKDGKELQGKIVGKTEETIKIRIVKSGIAMTKAVRRTQIKSILDDEEAAARKKQAEELVGEAEQPEVEVEAEKGSDEAKPEAKPGAAPDDAGSKKKRRELPVHIDLRMALSQSLILESYGSSSAKIEPKPRRYFVLIPFRYEAADEPYDINRYAFRFTGDRGRPKVKGFVLLEEKAPGGRRGGDQPLSVLDEMSVALNKVKGEKLYKEITVFLDDDDELMIALSEAAPPKVVEKKKAGSKARRSSGSRRRTGSRSRGRGGSRPPSRRRRSAGGRSSKSTRDKTKEDKESERAYLKSASKKKRKQSDDEKESKTTGSKSTRGGRRLDKGVPGSGWAAALLEIPNEMAVVTADVGSAGEVPVELNLIDALSRTGGKSKVRKSEGESDRIEVVADYAGSESAELSRLAVARLAGLRSSGKSSSKGKSSGDAADKRGRLIDGALLGALTSKDERTGFIAWEEITSTDSLPETTRSSILASEDSALFEAIFGLIEQDLAEAAEATEPAEAPKRTGKKRAPVLKKGKKAPEVIVYMPVGLPQSAAAPGVWGVLGALMGVEDEETATRALKLALEDGSMQGVSLLGQGSAAVRTRAATMMAKLPNTPTKHQAIRAILAGLLSDEEGDVDAGIVEVAKAVQGMERAGDPLWVSGVDDLLMRAATATRDAPDVQLKCLAILTGCALDKVLADDEIKQWLEAMTDELVAPRNQIATYQLIAAKWMPNRLPPLAGAKQAETPVAPPAKKPGRRRGKRAPKPKAPVKVADQALTQPEGEIEKFLVQGLETRREAIVRVPIIVALVRAGREEFVLERSKAADAAKCVEVIKIIQRATAKHPPSLVPGTHSRFASLGLVLGLARDHQDNAVGKEAATVLSDLAEGSRGKDSWRPALALKREFDWDSISRICAAKDTETASQARSAVAEVLGLVQGERTALDNAKDGGVVLGKLKDYSGQRDGKIAGKYQGLILCDALVPHYTLRFDEGDAKDKERTAEITDLAWSRQIIGLEAGLFDVSVGKDGKIEVKLGDVVVGTGQAPSGKSDAKKSGRPASKDPKQAEIARRLAALRGGGPLGSAKPKPGGPAFVLELPKLVAAIVGRPSTRGSFPAMAMVPGETSFKKKVSAKAKGKAEAKPEDQLKCAMAHLAFGTRQGSVKLGDGKPPTFDSLEVRVDAKGRIIRGARAIPHLQEIQVFLEPVSASGGK